ncbi:MAG: hypothetical protein PVF80_09705, partial [Gammaproteobacteria bacterium]
MNKRIAAFCLAILLPIAGTAAARDGAVPEHDIRVELDPASGDIRIADRFRIEGRERFEFTLASWLEIESLSIDGEVSAPRQAGGVWQVSLPGPGVHELDFELAGTLPPRAPGQAELTASSGADGAYLPAYEDWIP